MAQENVVFVHNTEKPSSVFQNWPHSFIGVTLG